MCFTEVDLKEIDILSRIKNIRKLHVLPLHPRSQLLSFPFCLLQQFREVLFLYLRIIIRQLRAVLLFITSYQ